MTPRDGQEPAPPVKPSLADRIPTRWYILTAAIGLGVIVAGVVLA